MNHATSPPEPLRVPITQQRPVLMAIPGNKPKTAASNGKKLTLLERIGQAAIDYATKYAMNRFQFDQPITNFQAIQWMIAESYTELEAARLLLMNAAFKKENGKFFAREASMAKYYATEAAERACHKAIQMLGGYGYTNEFPVERYARDVRITSIYEGTNQVQRLIIARDILSGLK
jgi:alkylation response protein AidB-like acyl-CoA dehydrogenase